MSLSRNISQQLDDLYRALEQAIRLLRYTSDYQRPATTVNGKVDQAQRWLSQPDLDQYGFGKREKENKSDRFPLHVDGEK